MQDVIAVNGISFPIEHTIDTDAIGEHEVEGADFDLIYGVDAGIDIDGKRIYVVNALLNFIEVLLGDGLI